MDFTKLDSVYLYLHEVTRYPSLWWLKILKENSHSNIEEKSGYDGEWLGAFMDDIVNNVDYISTAPMIELSKIVGNDIKPSQEQITMVNDMFDTRDEVKEFFQSFKNKGLILYSISRVATINKDDTFNLRYNVRYKEYEDPSKYRKKKLNELIKE